MTSITTSVENNNSRILSLLVAVPASVDKNEATSALSLAVKRGYTDCARILLTSGAAVDFNADSKAAEAVLRTAVNDGNASMAELLINNGCSVNASVSSGMASLHVAAKNGYGELVERLIQSGARINALDSSGNTPLILAAKDPHKTISAIKVLLSCAPTAGEKCDVDFQNNEKKTALHYTAHKAIGYQLLLEAGANPNLQDNDGNTPMMLAATEGFDNVIIRLLSYKANPDIMNNYGKAPIHFLAMKNHWEAVEAIAHHGGDVNVVDDAEKIPLWYAVTHNRPETVKTLLRANCRPDPPRQSEFSPLRAALSRNLFGIAKLLILSGCELKCLYEWIRTTTDDLDARRAEREERERLLFADDVGQDSSDNEDDDEELSDALSWFEDWVHMPHSLRQICRIYIRHHLRIHGTPDIITHLPLPPSIRDYVSLREVEDHHIRSFLI